METKYTRIETYVPIIPHTITRQLTPGLGKSTPTYTYTVTSISDSPHDQSA